MLMLSTNNYSTYSQILPHSGHGSPARVPSYMVLGRAKLGFRRILANTRRHSRSLEQDLVLDVYCRCDSTLLRTLPVRALQGAVRKMHQDSRHDGGVTWPVALDVVLRVI